MPPLLSQLTAAKNGLENAQINLCGVVTAHAEAKRMLELAEVVKLCEGVDGKNERERSAKLRLELSPEYIALTETEDALTEARCAFEVAGSSGIWLGIKPVCSNLKPLEKPPSLPYGLVRPLLG